MKPAVREPMSTAPLDNADRIVAQARPGEQVEAYVSSGSATSVRAYEGEVESFTQASSAGVGVRVVIDGKQGFASAGTFDDEVITELLAEARDNALFAQPDPHVGLAAPDGVAAATLDLWRDETTTLAPEAKIELALELERRVRAADPRITGVRVAAFGDSIGERAIAARASGRASSMFYRCRSPRWPDGTGDGRRWRHAARLGRSQLERGARCRAAPRRCSARRSRVRNVPNRGPRRSSASPRRLRRRWALSRW
jgi:hypothetical protein